MSVTTKRIMTELSQISKLKEYTIRTINDNIMKWEVDFMGPLNTPFENGKFTLTIDFTDNYPYAPPIISFKNKMFHPNINSYGNICLDILKTQWSPIMKMSQVILSIISLLDDPNEKDPFNSEAARLYSSDKDEYDRKVKELTKLYYV